MSALFTHVEISLTTMDLVFNSGKTECNSNIQVQKKLHLDISQSASSNEQICKQIINLVTSANHNFNIHISNGIRAYPNQRGMLHTFAYQIFISTNRLQDLFAGFSKLLTKLQYESLLSHRMFNTINLFQTLYCNPLIMKYIFKHSTLYKPLLMLLIRLLFVQIKRNQFNRIFITPIIDAHIYWKKTHYAYLFRKKFVQYTTRCVTLYWIDNHKHLTELYIAVKQNAHRFGKQWNSKPNRITKHLKSLCTIISNMVILNTNKNDECSIFDIIDIWFEFQADWVITKLPQNVDRELSVRCFECVYRMFFNLPKSSQIITIDRYIVCSKRCVWMNCKKTEITSKLYKCKGCMLVNYCSVRCQKQHWKQIHSQQCLRQTD
eukprot:450980_1